MPRIPSTYKSESFAPVDDSALTSTVDSTEFFIPSVEGLDATGAMALAGINNTGANFTGDTFSGTFFVTEQELEVEYIRKPHGIRTVGSRSDVTLSSLAVSADTDSSIFFKVRPVVRKYKIDGTFFTSSYEQLQTFQHLGASADLGGRGYEGLTSSTLGVRGRIETVQKYIKREYFDSSNTAHVETDYQYPWLYSYDLGNPAMLIPFFAAQDWSQQLFNDGGTAYAIARETIENSETYDALFTDVGTDFQMTPAWWAGNGATTALESGGGVANYRNSYLYSPIQGQDAFSYSQNLSDFTNEKSPSDLLLETWERWTLYPLHDGYRSPELNVWDIGANAYSLECVDIRANMPSQPETEARINSWLNALPDEYQITRHA